MNLISRTATAVVAALALSVPAGAVISGAHAAPGASKAEQQHSQVARKANKKIRVKLKRSAAYSHVGQRGVKVTAIVSKGKGKASGKVVFSINGKPSGKAKLKKGKASYRLPSKQAPGSYTVTANYKGKKAKTKVRVYSSAVALSATSFTISQSTASYDLPELTGSVMFKNKAANGGYVDIYQDGKKKGGSSSPFYCCMSSVASDGTFSFGSYSFLGKVQEKAPGTYVYQAFYTPTASYAEYIYSSKITVVVTP